MNEEVLTQQIRRFLKKVGITSQREIEKAVRDALQRNAVDAAARLPAAMMLEIPDLGLALRIDGEIALDE
ncbi:MAG: DUF6494 family protein [Gammaproteobacteria bacterium]